ncbi:MAG: ABC transporter ATP-binding protein [Deltaproteobacteria bacterium]|nr:ABC transporter ATP-binding protein [Deltaproteobacteria bacterium]
MILRTVNLTKNFGGLMAVDHVNLEVEEGAVHSIIGPNGAGKTTFFNILTGEISPTEGEVFFQEKKITGLKPHQVAQMRIGRSFQLNSLFKNLTVLENLRLAAHSQHPGHFNFLKDFRSFTSPVGQARKVLEEMEMTPIAAKKAGELSHAGQRTLEVAIALAGNPLLLLLDEPTSGMSPEETIRMIRLIKKIAKQRAMVVIEHNMKLVWSISSVITVLHQGQVIATGPPSQIEKNAEVRKAYLGGDAE